MDRCISIVLALALVTAACGSDADQSAPATTGVDPGASTSLPRDTTTTAIDTATMTSDGSGTEPTVTQFVDIYFVQGNGYATSIATAVPAAPAIASNAILSLIAGPTPEQQEAGLSSSVPTDSELLGLTIRDGLARVDFSDDFGAGGGTFSMTARLAQVVYTLTNFETVQEVEFWLDGEPVTVFSDEGLVLDGPVKRVDYLAALPLNPTLPDEIDLWEPDDLPDLTGTAEVRRVVLIAEDDVLNVRLGAGVDNPIIGALAAGTIVGLTGRQATVGVSTWFEIVTPAGAAWVNSHFLAEIVVGSDFFDDDRVLSLLDDMAVIMDTNGDLTEIASSRGLYIAHHADPVRFGLDQVPTVLTDPRTYRWPSAAIDSNDPDAVLEISPRTFSEAIGDSFVSTWDDPDREHAFDMPLAGGNGRIPSAAIPPELSGFHYVSVFDSGDNPAYDGLDWTSWHISIDYEDNRPVVVALTIDQWAP